MKCIPIADRAIIPPFGEPARDLRILNKLLWVHQRDLMARYGRVAPEVSSLTEARSSNDELLVYRDNLFFNKALLDEFIAQARASGHACQIAFSKHDKAIVTHVLPLAEHIREQGDVYVGELYYFPNGGDEEPLPLVIDSLPREMGYYNIPKYMAVNGGELVFHVPLRAFISVENWVHVYLANTPFGVFSWGRAHEELVEKSWREKIAVSLSHLRDRLNPMSPGWRKSHFFSSRRLVKVGKNCSIDPSAVIHGPTVIGDNVYIGAGAVITNSLIGDNVTVMQGCQVMLSVVSNKCYLPWNTGLFMSSIMENSMVAQLSCLQMCVVGRNTFIGAGNIFTDFHLLGRKLKIDHKGEKVEVEMPVIGSVVGHNCRIGSGFVVYPGRMIGSNTTLIYAEPSTIIARDVNVPPYGQELDPDAEPDQAIYRWPEPYVPKPDPGHSQPDTTHHAMDADFSKLFGLR